jgi:uncharacterized membrane protein
LSFVNTVRLSTTSIVLTFALIAIVVAWQLAPGITPARLLASAVLTCPLWAPLRGLMRGNRRTYAWATLCVIPYFILGVTEAVANPARRGWAGLCLGVALSLFAALILYLRTTNPNRAATLAP